MIVRVWRGFAPAGAPAEGYTQHLSQKVVPALLPLSGFQGMEVLTREDADMVEFIVTTRWDSLASVEAFAGDNVTQAVVEPEAQALLSRFEDTVRHYSVLESPRLMPRD